MAKLAFSFPRSDGKPRVDDQRILSIIISINRNGLDGGMPPEADCPRKTLYSRCNHWSAEGIFTGMMAGLAAEHAEERTVMIDATS